MSICYCGEQFRAGLILGLFGSLLIYVFVTFFWDDIVKWLRNKFIK